MVLYGIGKNYYTLRNFSLLPDRNRVLLIDGYKYGSLCEGREIKDPSIINGEENNEIFVLPSNSENIVNSLISGYGVNSKLIRTTSYINKHIVLGNINNYKYVMLTTDSDYLNYPYMPLAVRKDFTIRPILDQADYDRFDMVHDITDTHNIVFIVRDHCFAKLSEYGIIDYLKSVYTNSSWVTVMSDMCDGECGRRRLFGENYITDLKDESDLVLTYHYNDAQKYGLTYYEQTYPSATKSGEVSYDVLFVGKAKNRLELLHNTFTKLKEHDVSCHFYIYGVDKSLQLDDPDLVYNTTVPYEIYLQMVLECRCILEICEPGDETSYRYAEAVTYNKKFLVNDLSCIRRKYYDNRFMSVFSFPEDINYDWIKEDIAVDYKYLGDYSPENFLKFIDIKLA